MGIYDQERFDARFEWGPDGARELGRTSRVVIVVDVLSFSTAVDVAVTRGAIVYPRGWRRRASGEFATPAGAVTTVRRSAMSLRRPFSLSPRSMIHVRRGMKLVVSSPNGAQVCLAAAKSGATVIAGCLRNATAVAKAALAFGAPISVIAAGERWQPVDTLRPALEDLIGAGAILAKLGRLHPSPEARAATAAFKTGSSDLRRALADCSSGSELIASGFRFDVTWASKLDASRTVPVLRGDAFVRLDS
ncbi:MAG: 2-phosphosulfolactate phosphatase [Candidatus Binataceae bacterium]